MAAGFTVEPNPLLRWLIGATALVLLVGGLPVFARMAGYLFVPAPAWVGRVWGIALALGLFCGLCMAATYLRGWRRSDPQGSKAKHILVLLFAPVLCTVIGMDALLAGLPLVYTAVAGQPSEQTFVVARAEGFSDRKCRNKIELRDMPFMLNELCGFPEGFRNSLSPGQRIAVQGKGTALGLFVQSARALD